MTETTAQLPLAELREEAKKSLYFFCKGILGYDWLVPHIHGPVCAELQDVSTNRKLIMLPRGWLKSTICSIAFPMWLSINNPNIRTLIVQNSHENACKKLSVIAKQWEENQLLRAMFPELLPTTNSVWKSDSLCLNRSASFPEGTHEAAGTRTKLTSRHYDVIIEDDTVAPDMDELGNETLAPTHDDVQKAIGWHRTNALPLLNNPMSDLILVVGTRWYDHDLLRWIQDNEKQYKVITRACREDENGQPSSTGEITYPERFNEYVLEGLEAALGPYMFSCLYLNMPVRAEDMLFKAEWFIYYEQTPRMNELDVYTTVDVATDPDLAQSANIDYNVVLTAAKHMKTGQIYVLDYFRKRCNPGELCAAIFDHVVRFSPNLVGYDNTAYQRSIAYWLKELMKQQNRFFIMEPVVRHGKDAKKQAISNLQPLFANGLISLRPYMKELVSELLTFPRGSHDDVADALSMQLQLWKRTRTNSQVKLAAYGGDALNFDTAMASIEKRKTKILKSVVFDPMRHSPNRDRYGIRINPSRLA